MQTNHHQSRSKQARTSLTPAGGAVTNGVGQLRRRTHSSLSLIQTLSALLIGMAVPVSSPARVVTNANPAVVTTIPVSAPQSLSGIVASPTQHVVYVADELGKRIAVIDTITNQISAFISTAEGPIGLGISPDGKTLYVTEEPQFLEAISLTTLTQLYLLPVGQDPAIPGVSSDGTTVYVPLEGTGQVVSVSGPLAGTKINVGGEGFDVVFNHGNTSAYATNLTKEISVINTATGSVTKIKTKSLTFGLATSGTSLFATGINEVFVINTKSNTVTSTIKVPVPTPGDQFFLPLPAVTPDGAFLYVPVAQDETTIASADTVVVINIKTGKVVGNITVGQEPVQIAIPPNDVYAYVSNAGDGTVTVLALDHLPPF